MIIDFPVKRYFCSLNYKQLPEEGARKGKKIIWRLSVSLAVFLVFILALIAKNIFRYLVDKKSGFQLERYFSEQSPSVMTGKLSAD